MESHAPVWRRVVAGALAGVLAVGGLGALVPSPAQAAATVTVVPYTDTVGERLSVIYDETLVGGFVTAGNAWLTCSATQYCDRRPSQGLVSGGSSSSSATPAAADDYVNQSFVGAEAISLHGRNEVPLSSGVTVEIPAGAHVAHAELSWGGVNQSARYNPEIVAGRYDSLQRLPSLSLDAPAGPFEEVTGEVRVVSDNLTFASNTPQFYSARADVTDFFEGAEGIVDVYTVPGPIHDTYGNGTANGNTAAGWGITVVFAFDDIADALAAGYSLSRVQIVDGMLIAGSGSGWTEKVAVEFDPMPLTSGVTVGLIGFEGDVNKTGDRFELSVGADAVNVAPPWDLTQSANFWAGVSHSAIPLAPLATYPGAWPVPGDTWLPGNTYPESAPTDGTGFDGFANNFSVDAYDWVPEDFPWAVGTEELGVRLYAPSGEGFLITRLAFATPVAGLEIEKTTTASVVKEGDTIPFEFAVTNISSEGVTLGDIVVDDPQTTTPTFVLGHPDNPGNTGLQLSPSDELLGLDSGATAYFRSTKVVTAADVAAGVIVNTASVTGGLATVTTESVDSNEVTIDVIAPPVAMPRDVSADRGESVTFDPRAFAGAQPGSTGTVDSDMSEATLRFSLSLPGNPAGTTVSGDGLTATVPGEGVWQIHPDGTVTFTPDPSFLGTATSAMPYELIDENTLTDHSTLIVRYPAAPTDPGASPGDDGGLASTGGDPGYLLLLALVLTAVGVLTVLMARRGQKVRP